MASLSKIEWTETTWNPVTGCTKISHGCKHCYAERMSKRLQAMGMEKYRRGFEVTMHESTLREPFKWKKPSLVFVNSMSDLFHKAVPSEYVQSVFDVMNQATQHTFQVLTKRPSRVNQLGDKLDWTPNIWLGASIESERWLRRLDLLKVTGAHTKFLSLEPLLGPLPDLDMSGIDWVIVGGESGPGSRPMNAEWAIRIRDECLDAGVPFFFKQWGGRYSKAGGRELEGRTWDELPEVGPINQNGLGALGAPQLVSAETIV